MACASDIFCPSNKFISTPNRNKGCESYLSKYVHHLIVEIPKLVQNETPAAVLDLRKCLLCVMLEEESTGSDERTNYVSKVATLWKTVTSVHQAVSESAINSFSATYSKLLHWTGDKERLIRCFADFKESSISVTNLNILVITSLLERALGNIYLTSSSSKKCPSLLRDLLQQKELEDIFGFDAITILRILMGSPTTLNLRNVVWHGFPMLGEIPEQYATFLLTIVVSLGSILEDESIIPMFRPPVSVSKMSKISKDFPRILAADKEANLKLLKSSCFIPPGMLPAWKLVLEMFFKERYSDSVILLFPQLEHALRCLFAIVNRCPERVLTAESDTLYTTFDEIFAPTLPNGSENCLIGQLGIHVTEFIYDLLFFPEGPRLRDRLGHGEVDYKCIGYEIANTMLCAGLSLCLMFIVPWRYHLKKTIKLFRNIGQIMNSYRSIFHPSALLKQEIITCLESVTRLRFLEIPNSQDFLECKRPLEEEKMKIFKNVIKLWFSTLSPNESIEIVNEDLVGILHQLCQRILLIEVKYLFRPRLELEIIGILRQIVEKCQLATEQIIDMYKDRWSQLEQRSLRSRARQNFKTLLKSLQSFEIYLSTILFVMSCERSIEAKALSLQPPKKIKYLKHILKCTENVASLTHSSKNKWQESQELMTKCLKFMEQSFLMMDVNGS